jgi:hypothetical protein
MLMITELTTMMILMIPTAPPPKSPLRAHPGSEVPAITHKIKSTAMNGRDIYEPPD